MRAEDFDNVAGILPQDVKNRARHVIEEIERVQMASICLAQDDSAGFGKLMVQGHQSLWDLYQVSTDELDGLVDIALNLEGCYGARLTGAGFGGCTVNLVEEEKAEEFSIKLESKYRAKYQKGAEVYICQASRGAYAEPI